MALETSGFQLSQFDRAPQVPGNIGVVDTKSIYGAVVDALKTNEALRTTQQVQAMNDAETALATQKARSEMGLLAPEAEARRAKAELFTAEAPYQRGLLPLGDEARRAELAANIAKNKLLSQPGIAEQAVLGKILTPAEREIRNLSARLQDPDLTDAERDAIQVRLKRAVDANTAAKMTRMVTKVLPDGSLVTVPEYPGQSAQTAAIAGGTVRGGVVPDMGGQGVLAGPMRPGIGGLQTVDSTGGTLGGPKAQARAGILATEDVAKFGAPSPALTEIPADQGTPAQQEYARGLIGRYGNTTPLSFIRGEEPKKSFIKRNEEIVKDAQSDIATQQTNLDIWQNEAAKEAETENTIRELIKDVQDKGLLISGGSIFGRGLRALAPGEADAYRAKLASVVQKIQLGNMLRLKNASATGATGFGNLTQSENTLLQADYGALTSENLPSDAVVATLERALQGFPKRRQEALDAIQSRIARNRQREIQGLFNIDGVSAFSSLSPVHSLEQTRQPSAESAAPVTTPGLQERANRSVSTAAYEESAAPAAAAPAPAPASAAPAALAPPVINFGETPTEPTSAAAPLTPPAAPSAPPAAPVMPGTPGSKIGIVKEEPSFAPAWSVKGAAQRVGEAVSSPEGQSRIKEFVRFPETVARYGTAGLNTLVTGEPFKVPEKGPIELAGEKIGEILSGETLDEMRQRFRKEDEILRTRPNSRAAYDIRRDLGRPGPAPKPKPKEEAKAAKEEETTPPEKTAVLSAPKDLPEIPLSKEAKDIVQRVYDEYLANKDGGKPVAPVLSARKGGEERPGKLTDRTIWAILSNPGDYSRMIRDESLRGEFDMAASRALMDARMRRAEQLRAYEAARPARGR